MKTKLIALTGPKGVGKTTTAEGLRTASRETLTTVLSFASPVKYAAQRLGWDGKKDAKGRKLLQTIGQAARDYDPDVWVREMKRAYLEVPPWWQSVIDDCRYANEAAMVRELGGVLVALNRKGIDYTAEHESERGDAATHADLHVIIEGGETPEQVAAEIIAQIEAWELGRK